MDCKTRTGAAILDWAGDPMADALMMRITGGLNALARSGGDPALSALYHSRSETSPGRFPASLPNGTIGFCLGLMARRRPTKSPARERFGRASWPLPRVRAECGAS